jgi:hypothetical protein
MKITKIFYISPRDMASLAQNWDFYESEYEEAPLRLGHEGKSPQVPFCHPGWNIQITDFVPAGVQQIGRIKVDLNGNEHAQKKRRASATKGKEEPIRVKLVLSLGSKMGILEVKAYHGTSEVGRAEIEYAEDRGRLKQ